MKKITEGIPISIIAFKHDGAFHRLWRRGTVLDISTDKYIIMNNKTLVEESDERHWYTREPAICIFYKKRWFNIICMLKPQGISFYCNMESPIIEQGNTLRYIDYDLDIKVFPNGKVKILDTNEYQHHRLHMSYSADIEQIIQKELKALQVMIKQKQDPFNNEFVHYWEQQYKENLINKSANK